MLHTYVKYIKIYLIQKMEYRIEFIFDIIASSFNVFNYYFGIIIIFSTFKNINGWSYQEVVFLFSFNWLSMSLSSMFFWAPMKNLGGLIKSGEFDSYLIKPISPLFHLVAKQFQHTFLARLAIAVVLAVTSIGNLQINISGQMVMLIILYTVCGILIHTGILILLGATSFFIVDNTELVDVVINRDYGLKSFIDYPISIFNGFIQMLLTLIIPFAFVNYYPAVVILGKESMFGSSTIWVIPLAALAVLGLSILVWSIGLKHYSSTGN